MHGFKNCAPGLDFLENTKCTVATFLANFSVLPWPQLYFVGRVLTK